VRACERLTRAASEHEVRIKDLVRQLTPMTRSPGTWASRPGGSGTPIRALLAISAARLTVLYDQMSPVHEIKIPPRYQDRGPFPS